MQGDASGAADQKVYSTAGSSRHPLQVKIMRGLSLDEANTIIAASFAAAKKRNCRPMSAIVLDAGGRVKALSEAGRRFDAAL